MIVCGYCTESLKHTTIEAFETNKGWYIQFENQKSRIVSTPFLSTDSLWQLVREVEVILKVQEEIAQDKKSLQEALDALIAFAAYYKHLPGMVNSTASMKHQVHSLIWKIIYDEPLNIISRKAQEIKETFCGNVGNTGAVPNEQQTCSHETPQGMG
jgi:hypothetical protein